MQNEIFMVLTSQTYLDVWCATSEKNALVLTCPKARAFMILKLRDIGMDVLQSYPISYYITNISQISTSQIRYPTVSYSYRRVTCPGTRLLHTYSGNINPCNRFSGEPTNCGHTIAVFVGPLDPPGSEVILFVKIKKPFQEAL